MIRTMNTAANTLGQIQLQLDTISNNIANSNTKGYKAKQATFQELLYQQHNNDKLDRTLRQSPVGIRQGVGAHISQIQSNETQGSIQLTGRNLDFAMTAENQYFNVVMQDGSTGFTRQGNFYMSPQQDGTNLLVTGDGYPVLSANGNTISFPQGVTEFTMSEAGTLNVMNENGQVIQYDLAVTKITKPQVMEQLNGGTYLSLPANLAELGYAEGDVLTELQGQNRNEVSMQIGALEMSNVDLSKEMTNLIAAQRSYQYNSRAVTIADQMLGLINGIR
ncbi:flagellar hook-basal body protein [Lysinibacillus sp. 3P01SB]|uniref:flagellar hook-basal body protein n=1 Tax=Lysinibacillus sp. 3P01SB TaxID=3132284 RepID=UPI0039A562F2